jgi:rubrerythrin
MGSQCPKCKSVVDDDAVCCAEVRYTWKCEGCGKLSTGFVVPYGRCFLCGGELKVVSSYHLEEPQRIEPIREAVQFEIDMYQFYRLAQDRMQDADCKSVLDDLRVREEDHLNELSEKYHVHLEAAALEPSAQTEELLAHEIFKGIDFLAKESIEEIYRRALELERRTLAHFQHRVETLPSGMERELYRELAAEEVEHVALLEGELESLGAGTAAGESETD